LIGESPAIMRLRESVAAIAQSDYPVLVRGESGSGKELVVRMVHTLSPRAGRPFIALNCPAIPENLLESELFGHERGAFTGADRSRDGLFVAADKGTIHLDEIGDISHNVQTKLLRVLQEHELRPLGSSKTVRVEARVVASTNQNLEAKIASREFRQDLYYRLNVLTLTVPPLRERMEDVPLLARFFLDKACTEMRIEPKTASPEVLEWLIRREWPGNVRELQNFMRRLAVFCPSERVEMRTVRLAEPGDVSLATLSNAGSLPSYKEAKAEVVHHFTAGYVRELLTGTGGTSPRPQTERTFAGGPAEDPRPAGDGSGSVQALSIVEPTGSRKQQAGREKHPLFTSSSFQLFSSSATSFPFHLSSKNLHLQNISSGCGSGGAKSQATRIAGSISAANASNSRLCISLHTYSPMTVLQPALLRRAVGHFNDQ
jgi:hypothetical protein